MRTVSSAALPPHLHWQAAFTIQTYQTLSPVVWQHAFVSDTPMTNWSGCAGLLLTWVADEGLTILGDCPSPLGWSPPVKS
jgi:hypothetical protein